MELAVTVTGLSGFMQANQGFMFAMLKDPKDREPSLMTADDRIRRFRRSRASWPDRL